jgi:hypothetical protein
MFILDTGIRYNMSCSHVRPSAVSDEVLGAGNYFGQVSVNAVEGFSPDIVVAVSGPGQGLCDNLGEGVWWLAFVPGAPIKAINEAFCTFTEPSDPEGQTENSEQRNLQRDHRDTAR